MAPKYQNKIKHIEFIRLSSNQVMSIVANENGVVDKIDASGITIKTKKSMDELDLVSHENYIHYKNRSLVYSELEKYDKAIDDLDQAIDKTK